MSNIDAIAALLPIPDEKRRRQCLLLCLRKVRWYRAMRDLDTQTIESPKVSRAELAKVARQARKLRATLEALPFAARLALVSEAARGEHLEQSFDGLLRRRGEVSGLFISLERRREVLKQLATEAEAAEAKLKKRPGAEQNDALYWLVQEIAEIWREHVDTRFARSDNRGSASAFTRALVALVDPEVGSGTLDLAMREAIGKIRPKKIAEFYQTLSLPKTE